MAVSNAKVAELLRLYASALVLEGVDRFKVKAYRRAADTLETIPDDLANLVARGEDVKQLPGVGTAIGAKIEEILSTGTLSQLERSIGKLSPELVELTGKPALDAKKVLRIYKKLDIGSLAELEKSLESGEIRELFGARLDFHIRQGLDARPRMLLWAADDMARRVEDYLRLIPGVTDVASVGSLRRRKDTVGDLNFLVSGKSAVTIFKQFANFGAVQSKKPLGKHEMLYKLSSGRAITVAWAAADHWGLELVLRTGSKLHLEGLRNRARKSKIALSAKSFGRDSRTEAMVYARLDLEFIAPELREGRGEVEAAAERTLPTLLELKDLRGDLHMHTTASDGANSLAEMADAAVERGYEYIAITDHSQSLKIANGLTEKRLLQQVKEIDKLNSKLTTFTILKSAEVDILEDGSLDYSKSVLRELDLTICSIHSRFNLGKRAQTERIMRAMDNRYFNILGHATGRLLLKREGYELDMGRVIKHAAALGCYFEINSSPNRLDLSDEHAKMAKDAGVKIAINTDAHSIQELGFISAGLNQARRAWLESIDVLNAVSLKKLTSLLRR